MGKRGRGREGLVRCEKCGRTTRRDKAVYIEKPMLTNPLERHQVSEPDSYRRAIFREVCYCISCGKHGRIFEKKKQQNERLRERERQFREGPRRPHYGDRRPYGPARPAGTGAQAAQESKPQEQAPAEKPAPAQEPAAEQPAEEELPPEAVGQENSEEQQPQ